MKISELFWLTYVSEYTTIDNVDYAFIEQDDTLLILFQGSNQVVDWLDNFNFPAKPYKHMDTVYYVHRGFLKCWKIVEDIIINKITEKDDKGNFKWNKIIVSGYSHGGALAMLCHECVWFWRPDIRDNCWSYAFEGPRVYWGWKVRKDLRERWDHFILIRNHKDIVTKVPPLLFGYCHVGNLLHIGRYQCYKKVDIKPNIECIKSHFPELVKESLEEIDFNIDFKK